MSGQHRRTLGDEERAPRRTTQASRGMRSSDLLQSAGQQRAYRRDPAARRSQQQAQTQSHSQSQARTHEHAQESSLVRWVKGGAIVLLIAAVVAVALVFLRNCAPEVPEPENGGAVEEETAGYKGPYDQDSFRRDGTRWAYVVDGTVRSRLGIDVSESQLWIDWQAVAGDGIDFAMIRAGYRGATEGDLYADEYFSYNLEAARAAGIDCGVYFFSQAVTVDEAVEEAEFVLSLLDGAALTYPIAFDSEEFAIDGVPSRISELSRDQMTSIAEAFCNRIRQAGYEAIIYGNAYDLARYNKGNWESDGIWWAEYDADLPSIASEIGMWQYANSGQVAGIDINVDMNLDLRDALDAPTTQKTTDSKE